MHNCLKICPLSVLTFGNKPFQQVHPKRSYHFPPTIQSDSSSPPKQNINTDSHAVHSTHPRYRNRVYSRSKKKEKRKTKTVLGACARCWPRPQPQIYANKTLTLVHKKHKDLSDSVLRTIPPKRKEGGVCGLRLSHSSCARRSVPT